MKKLLLLLAVAVLMSLSAAYSQNLSDYVLRVSGDTLVIKTFDDMGGVPNALYQAMILDTMNVPAGRVYELQANGFYPLDNNPNAAASRQTEIFGSDSRSIATNKDALSAPPLITGDVSSSSNAGGIGANGSLTIKNCDLVPAANDGTLAWAFTGTNNAKLRLLYDNCIMERTRWIFVVTGNDSCDLTFRNCYFVNMNGQPCRRNGGVLDCFSSQDSLVVENCTHINAQGSMYKFRANLYNRIIINHNTFINCAGYIFMNLGYQSNMSLTNNIFVNSNLQAYPRMQSIDSGEQDLDWLPMGLVNVYPDSADAAAGTLRKTLVQSNLAYWDPYLSDMNTILDNTPVNGVTTWQSQMIVANARTDSMFQHMPPYNTTPYSYLQTDTWKNVLPTFADPQNLFNTQSGGALYNLKTFALATVDTGAAGSSAVLADWRLVNQGALYYVYSDWPIPVNLSYSDANLQAAGIGGFPLGDLNWFPSQKASWQLQRETELQKIQVALDNAHLVSAVGPSKTARPGVFELQQNYPNPFNPSTQIEFNVPTRSVVTLKVYNVLGQEVATLINGELSAGQHSATFNASRLSSGAYFYTLTAGNFVSTRKMMFVK